MKCRYLKRGGSSRQKGQILQGQVKFIVVSANANKIAKSEKQNMENMSLKLRNSPESYSDQGLWFHLNIYLEMADLEIRVSKFLAINSCLISSSMSLTMYGN